MNLNIKKWHEPLERAVVNAGLTKDWARLHYLIGHYSATLATLEYVFGELEQAAKGDTAELRQEIDRALSILESVLHIDAGDGHNNKGSV